MFGQLSHEAEVKVGASKAWDLYGTIKLALMVKEHLRDTFLQVDILEGDGGVGTVIKLVLAEGFSYKEKFTKVDQEHHVKETEMIEGGLRDMGFSLYRVRLEVIGKEEEELCVIKSTIEYEVPDDGSVDVSIISVKPFADIAEVAKKLLTTSAGTN
ncbi:hypothetical protein ACJRO7_034298 [Eucalyptus globulus]|uniref:Bet v I/Major latex protein domain-containing protein n=1 Tax=Eucalyptus globulus TaxID=34317 RepID=A0ABD3J724_EUCGL